MTTKQTIQMSSADQALRIMDADGEAAMWHFIHSVAPTPMLAPAHEHPKTAVLDDGSMVHLVKNTYMFDTFPFNNRREPENRPSSNNLQALPDAFQTPSPLFLWPNHVNLRNRVLENLANRAEDYTQPDQHTQVPPAPLLIQHLNQQIEEAVNNAVPSLEPSSPNIVDHLGSYMDDLAYDVVNAMDPQIRKALIHHIEALSTH